MAKNTTTVIEKRRKTKAIGEKSASANFVNGNEIPQKTVIDKSRSSAL